MKKLFLLINILFLITNCFSCDDSSDVLTSISPNEQIIISYVSKATFGEPDIHLMNLDGTDEKNLTNSTIGEWDPQFSPDGTKIIFYSVANGDYEIFIINIDGTNLQRLTNSPGADWGARFSPDGNRIVFFTSRNFNFDIYTMAIDGSKLVQLTNSSANERDPVYSSDGTKILFLSDGEIYLMNNDGTDKKAITNEMHVDPKPRFSPDGSSIIFSTEKNFPRSIYTINIDGTNLNKLAIGLGATYSPSGDKIAFAALKENSIFFQIFIMNKDGSNVTNLSNNDRNDYSPIFTPDESKIVFGASFGNEEIFIMDINGDNQKNLTNNDIDDYGPVVCSVNHYAN